MSENSGESVTQRTENAKDTSERNKGDTLEKRRQRLLTEIRTLKLLITQTECRLGTFKFKNICDTKDLWNEQRGVVVTKLVNVDALIKNELHTFAGIYCKKIGNGFIFSFQCWDTERLDNSYWIQLFNDGGKWQIGQWILPMSIDVKQILLRFNIDSASNMKYFLRECKHEIDCYNRRHQQYRELEMFMSDLDLYNCCVEAGNGFTRITMKLFKDCCSSSDEMSIIFVDIFYKSNETRPTRIIVDCDNIEALSEEESNDFRLYFKSFKELDLKDAAEKVLTSFNSKIIWKRVSQDDVIEIDVTEDQSDDMESNSTILLERSSRNTRKRVNKEVNHSETENDDVINLSNDKFSPNDVSKVSNGTNKRGRNNNNNLRQMRKSNVERMNVEKIKSTKKRRESLPLKDLNENRVDRSTTVLSRGMKKLSNDRTIVDDDRTKLSQLRSSNNNDIVEAKSDGQFSKILREVVDARRKSVKTNFPSKKRLVSSTPLIQRNVHFSKMHMDDDISVIDERVIDASSDEKDANEQVELLKDLRAVNFNANNDDNRTKKLPTNKTKVSTRGRKRTRPGRKV